MERCNMFVKFNERRKENSQISSVNRGLPTVCSPSQPGEGVGHTWDLCAGFCFHFDLFVTGLQTEVLQNACSVPFGYITSLIYCIFLLNQDYTR